MDATLDPKFLGLKRTFRLKNFGSRDGYPGKLE